MSQKYPLIDQYFEGKSLEVQLQMIDQRDPRCLSALFTEINPVLVGLAKAQRLTDEVIEDLVHQTWQRFFEKYQEFKGQSHISSFVCGILINKVREHRRSQKKSHLQDPIEDFENRAFSSEGWWNKEPQDPLQLFQNKTLGKDISDCFDDLTEQQKNIFLLREVENLETEELCNLFELSISNLRVILFRTKEKLRNCLEGKAQV